MTNETELNPKAEFEKFPARKKGEFTKAIGRNDKGEFAVAETQKMGYTDREMRDKHYRQLQDEGKRGVVKFTTHENNDPRIIYVVAWVEPARLQ